MASFLPPIGEARLDLLHAKMAIASTANQVNSPIIGPAPGFYKALDAMASRLTAILT